MRELAACVPAFLCTQIAALVRCLANVTWIQSASKQASNVLRGTQRLPPRLLDGGVQCQCACAEALASHVEPRLRYFLTHAQPRRQAAKQVVANTAPGAQCVQGTEKKEAGHLYLGSLCGGKSGARGFVPPQTAPLDYPAWQRRHADSEAIAYCYQCMAHINEEYLVCARRCGCVWL